MLVFLPILIIICLDYILVLTLLVFVYLLQLQNNLRDLIQRFETFCICLFYKQY